MKSSPDGFFFLFLFHCDLGSTTIATLALDSTPGQQTAHVKGSIFNRARLLAEIYTLNRLSQRWDWCSGSTRNSFEGPIAAGQLGLLGWDGILDKTKTKKMWFANLESFETEGSKIGWVVGKWPTFHILRKWSNKLFYCGLFPDFPDKN